MSSRRKSRPVRRLDPTCSNLQGQGDVNSPGDFAELQHSDASISPCGASDGASDGDHTDLKEHHSNEREKQTEESTADPPKWKKSEKPPEGVYIVHPQGVSDDEGADQMPLSQDADSFDRKRARQAERDVGQGDAAVADGSFKAGLDLSVKRRKTDGDPVDDVSTMDGATHGDEGFSDPTFGAGSLHDTGHKYEQLMQLLAQQTPLLEAMQKVDMSREDLVELQRSRMTGAKPGSAGSPPKEAMQATAETSNTSTSWHSSEQWPSDDVVAYQQPNMENSSNVSQIPPYSSPTLPPAVAAAFMASLVSNNNEQSVQEGSTKADLLQKFFKRTSAFSQVSSSMSMPPGGQYSDDAESVDTITSGTVSSGVGSIKKGTLDPTNFDEDVFDKYITKFTSKNPCMQTTCPHINRDHYHCTDHDCSFQRFTNKSDVIRHYNMHKKRDNSLAHGFMRFAPTDDCSRQFGNCHLNGKSTHYHCLQTNCTKVYTSTSDVMTHENFHKKNQQFVSNGFERYRATESCGMQHCPFSTQRTTHFHCTRPGCNFTFKNKCDIEKHKAYHTRDDAYTRQGFKKFYKNECCQFRSCAWNRTANHFHCLRKNCGFAFTSTGQMVSHKRKHDRQDLMGAGGDSLAMTSSASVAAVSGPPTLFPRPMITMSSSQAQAVAAAPSAVIPFVRAPVPPFYSLQGHRSSPVLLPSSLSFISPYMASRILNRPVLQEAARKVFAQIPSTVAAVSASLPQSASTFSPKTEPRKTDLLSLLPTLGQIKTEAGYGGQRTEVSTLTSVNSNHLVAPTPPPAYNERSRNESPASLKLDDRFERDQPLTELQSHWIGTIKRMSPVEARESLDQSTYSNFSDPNSYEQSKDQVLNLSAKSDSSDGTGDKKLHEQTPNAIDVPSKAVLKYFRGLGPDECAINNCMFQSCPHFHCVIEDCCAAFNEKQLVLNHTRFHEKLDKLGLEQPISSQFAPLFPTIAGSSRPDSAPSATSPPPGYIALNRKSELPDSKYEADAQGNIVLRRANLDLSRDQDRLHDNAAEINSLATKSDENSRNFAVTGGNPVYNYLSRLIAENKLTTGFVGSSGNLPGVFPPFQNSGLSLDGTLLSSTPASMDPAKKLATGNSSSDGFLHIRPGMSCVRRDCKYVMQNHWHCTLNRCRYVCKSLAKAQSHRQAHDSLEEYARSAKECFRSYTVKKMCPNPNCEFRLRGHYHCLKPGCQFVTIGTSKLPWHMKKHEKIARREASGFKYYTKKEQCGNYDCKYNGLFSHYHCIRAGCSFAFQYKHQMSTHVRKHLRRMLGRSYNGIEVPMEQGDVDHSNVDSGDDSLPLIVDEADELEQRPGAAIDSNRGAFGQSSNSYDELSRPQLAFLEQLAKIGVKTTVPSSTGDIDSTRTSPTSMNTSCNQNELHGFSSDDGVLDLRANQFTDQQDSNSNSSIQKFEQFEPPNSCSGNSSSGNFDEEVRSFQHSSEQELPISSNTAVSKPTTLEDSSPLFNKFRINNDVIDGFKRYESSEGCGDNQCSFIHKVSHYHCTREGCNYRFTGRTHMFKHQQHHERVAGLVRDDFKRFKTTQQCDVEGCPYTGTSTHFHCLRCSFKCTDSAKVGTHRRQHVKADTLEQSGFERFRGKEDCMRETCKYRTRNTSHFHCLQPGCTYSVVGLSGIEQHYNKHKRSSMLAQVCGKAGQEMKFTLYQPQSSLTSGDSPFNATSSAAFPHLNAETFARMQAPCSPVPNDRSSVSPAFNGTTVVTSQVDPVMLQGKAANTPIDLSDSLKLSVGHDRRSGVATAHPGLPTGIGLS